MLALDAGEADCCSTALELFHRRISGTGDDSSPPPAAAEAPPVAWQIDG